MNFSFYFGFRDRKIFSTIKSGETVLLHKALRRLMSFSFVNLRKNIVKFGFIEILNPLSYKDLFGIFYGNPAESDGEDAPLASPQERPRRSEF